MCRSPREASDFANQNSQYDDLEWKEKRVAIMEEIVRCKLAQHSLIKETLLRTGNRTIVEMNDSDGFWGWGPDRDGQNQLGKIWMKLRDEISSGVNKSTKELNQPID